MTHITGSAGHSKLFEKHGTANTYNLGCRCQRCKKAKSEYRRLTPINGHGTKWYYDKGCRCDDCINAKQAYRRKLHPEGRLRITTDIIAGTRICYLCKREKTLDSFVKNRCVALGRSNECLSCHNERSRKNKRKPGHRFGAYKNGAKVRGIEFALSYDEFMVFWGGACHYCGHIINGIGLDRKNNNGPYSTENIVACCKTCNRAKGVLTYNEFISLCFRVVANIKDLPVSRTD